MKIFVAGGTGVIGRRAVPALVDAGHEVTVIARHPDRDALVEGLRATPVRVDLFDADGLMAAAAGHDAVVNLATHIPSMTKAASKRAWDENDRIRKEGSSNLVAATKRNGVARFVQESITFPYADAGDTWIDEDGARPASVFSAPIDHAEREVASFSADGGAGVVLRFAQFYASDSDHTRTQATVFRRRVHPFPGAPDAHTALIGVDAAARAVVCALDVAPGTYNVADDDPPTRRELGEAVAVAIGRKPPRAVPAGPIRRINDAADVLMRSHRIDNRRLRTAAGWRPDHAGGAGLAAVVAEILGERD